jgi:hypothetical protein
MCSKQTTQTIQQELPTPRVICCSSLSPKSITRKCLSCGLEVQREILDLNCSCFRHRLCHFCAYLAFETPGIDIVIIKNIWSGVCLIPRKLRKTDTDE